MRLDALPSAGLLRRFRQPGAGGVFHQALTPAYRALLAALGDPQDRLPPVIHVAGTNGKGSTCAFLRAMAEAAGQRVHVYTSPHLVRFHERIRVAGELIGEEALVALLEEALRLGDPSAVTEFEAATAVALAAFARAPADLVVLETGLGGRLDATNVVARSVATVITRLSFDHRAHLGGTLAEIAREKAGILRPGIPCFAAFQPSAEARTALTEAAATTGAPLFMGDDAWRVAAVDPGDATRGFRFEDRDRCLTLPAPALPGAHQFLNAGLAVAVLAALPFPVGPEAVAEGLRRVDWPARLQRLTQGALVAQAPEGWELWLDGGHNDSAGEVLAAQAAAWRREDEREGRAARPLVVIMGMLANKTPEEFIHPLVPFVDRLCAIPIADEPLAFPAAELARRLAAGGMAAPETGDSLDAALARSRALAWGKPPGRLLITGSLYLAGQALRENGRRAAGKT